MAYDIWGYSADAQYTPGTSLAGYRVEAKDGHIGKVDEVSDDFGAAYIIVDIGTWIRGKTVILPAGTVSRIVPKDKTIHVNRTKGQIKDAPQYDPNSQRDDAEYRTTLGTYYGSHNR